MVLRFRFTRLRGVLSSVSESSLYEVVPLLVLGSGSPSVSRDLVGSILIRLTRHWHGQLHRVVGPIPLLLLDL